MCGGQHHGTIAAFFNPCMLLCDFSHDFVTPQTAWTEDMTSRWKWTVCIVKFAYWWLFLPPFAINTQLLNIHAFSYLTILKEEKSRLQIIRTTLLGGFGSPFQISDPIVCFQRHVLVHDRSWHLAWPLCQNNYIIELAKILRELDISRKRLKKVRFRRIFATNRPAKIIWDNSILITERTVEEKLCDICKYNF